MVCLSLPRSLVVAGFALTASFGAIVAADAAPSPVAAVGLLRNSASNLCLDAAGTTGGTASNVGLWSCDSGADQAWGVNRDGNLVNGGAGLCVIGLLSKSRLEACSTNAALRFAVRAAGTHIELVHSSGMCLDLVDNTGAQGAQAHLATCDGGRDQRWTLDTTSTEARAALGRIAAANRAAWFLTVVSPDATVNFTSDGLVAAIAAALAIAPPPTPTPTTTTTTTTTTTPTPQPPTPSPTPTTTTTTTTTTTATVRPVMTPIDTRPVLNPRQLALGRWYTVLAYDHVRVDLGIGQVGRGLVFDGQDLWVPTSSTISRVRAADGQVLARVPAPSGTGGVDGVVFDGVRLWMAMGSGAVLRLRTATGTFEADANTRPCGANKAADVAFDGYHVWVACRGTSPESGTLVKLRATDRAVIQTYALDGTPDRLTFDGTHVWIVGANSLRRIRPTGPAVELLDAPCRANALAFDGATLWCATDQGLERRDPSDGRASGEPLLRGINVRALAFDGRYLWATTTAGVARIDVAAGSVSQFAVPEMGNPTLDGSGAAFDGVNLWITRHNGRVAYLTKL